MVREPREEGSEEYRDSEKFEVKHWDLDAQWSLRHLIARVNQIRRDHPALQRNDGLRFHGIENDALICWSKRDSDGDDVILCIVNLDPWSTQSGWTDLELHALGLEPDASFVAHDLLTDARYPWT